MLSSEKFKELMRDRQIDVQQLAGHLARASLSESEAAGAIANWQKGLFKPKPRMEDIRFVEGEFQIAEPEHDYLQLFKDKSDPKGADLRVRSESFGKVADEVFDRLYADAARAPEDLIHVTCSGYLAPSPAEKMVSRKKDANFFVTMCSNNK